MSEAQRAYQAMITEAQRESIREVIRRLVACHDRLVDDRLHIIAAWAAAGAQYCVTLIERGDRKFVADAVSSVVAQFATAHSMPAGSVMCYELFIQAHNMHDNLRYREATTREATPRLAPSKPDCAKRL